MKKKLDVSAIQNELEGSAFFPGKRPAVPSPVPEPQEEAPAKPDVSPAAPLPSPVTARQTGPEALSPDTVIPRHHDTNHDTMTPRYQETMIPLSEAAGDDEIYEVVRRAVKQVGKEPATQRLTLEEKQALMDIEYTYRRQGIKTSGNEIIRIATNYLLEEYKKHGEGSILAKILTLLNS